MVNKLISIMIASLMIGIVSASITSPIKTTGNYDQPTFSYSGNFSVEITGNESKWIDKIHIENRTITIYPKPDKDLTYTECIELDKDGFCAKYASVKYNVPLIMPVKDITGELKESITTTSKDLKEVFTYRLSTDEHYVKLGESSVTIIEDLVQNGTTPYNYTYVRYNFTTDDFSAPNQVKWNWNGTNYTFYDDSLVLMVNFDNNSLFGENDRLVKDLSQYGNSGTVQGGTNISWIPNGKYGGAFNSTGNNPMINFTSSGVYKLNQTLTIAMWFYNYGYRQNAGANDYLIQAGNQYRIFYSKNENKFWFQTNNNNSDSGTTFDAYTPETNKWVHMTMTWNTTTLAWYINGVLRETKTFKKNVTVSNTGINLMRSYYLAASTWNGSIDNVLIWNRTLSGTEVYQIYASDLEKYDTQNWSFASNQTNLSMTGQNYYLCVSNSSGFETCSFEVTLANPSKISRIYPYVENKVPYIRLGRHLVFT